MITPAPGTRYVAKHLVTQEMIDRYAKASGDHNPLHVDPAFAATTPLGGTVAHGMLALAWVSDLLSEAFADGWLIRSSLHLRFRAPARPRDELEVTATVESDATGDQATKIALSVRAVNQRGEAVLEGQATVQLPA